MTWEPVWIRDDVVLALHGRQLAEHGGARGVRDMGLLESALNAPKQKFHYEKSGITSLAADYGFVLAKNHPFVDGNKRTVYVCMRLFLKLNGHDIGADKKERIHIMQGLAAGKVSRDQLIDWLNEHVVKLNS